MTLAEWFFVLMIAVLTIGSLGNIQIQLRRIADAMEKERAQR